MLCMDRLRWISRGFLAYIRLRDDYLARSGLTVQRRISTSREQKRFNEFHDLLPYPCFFVISFQCQVILPFLIFGAFVPVRHVK